MLLLVEPLPEKPIEQIARQLFAALVTLDLRRHKQTAPLVLPLAAGLVMLAWPQLCLSDQAVDLEIALPEDLADQPLRPTQLAAALSGFQSEDLLGLVSLLNQQVVDLYL